MPNNNSPVEKNKESESGDLKTDQKIIVMGASTGGF
jgi:hypothetical protein